MPSRLGSARAALGRTFSVDLVASGGTYPIEAEELADVEDGSGTARVQCCIHPWMRATLHVR